MMSNDKHTPGPWAAVQESNKPATQWSIVAGHRTLGVFGEAGKIAANRENARIAAVAPELLEALRGTLAAFRECIGRDAFADFESTNPQVRAALAAIVKATGSGHDAD